MEENKNLCPQCGMVMNEVYEKPALNLICSECGCRIATTRWDDIDLDDTNYKIYVKQTNDIDLKMIKLISELTGLNYIQSKDLLIKGGIIVNCKAIEVEAICSRLNDNNIDYNIDPIFPW